MGGVGDAIDGDEGVGGVGEGVGVVRGAGGLVMREGGGGELFDEESRVEGSAEKEVGA